MQDGGNREEIEMNELRKASLEVTLDLNIECPYCGEANDMRERDSECDYFWSQQATNRLNGKHEINETHECYNCGKVSSINSFEIM